MRKQLSDPGLGQKFEKASKRVINKDGSFNVKRVGFGYSFKNTYQTLIKMSWPSFLIWIVIFMVSANLLFTITYLLIGSYELNGIVRTNDFSIFLQTFFFSFQTFTTVGYGSISPVGHMAGLVASIEAMAGLISFAMVTGILYGRFSRPTARFQYSENALIAPYKNGWSLQFRFANHRKSQIIELEADVMLVYTDKTNEHYDRKFFKLDLESNHVLFLPLNWTLVHPIDENSPLYGLSREDLIKKDAEILILIKGFDDTFSQVVHSRYSYVAHEIIFGGKFVRPFYINDSQETILDSKLINKFDHVPFDMYKTTNN